MSCKIVLDNHGSYHPGDTVSGKVVCNFSSTENFKAITCIFLGREHTSWTEQQFYYDNSTKSKKLRTVPFTGDNLFLRFNLNLASENTVSPGQYEYPFSFILPQNIANPYDGSYGYIKYYIKVCVKKSTSVDYEDEITLDVVAPINFNDIRHQLQLEPVAYQDEKTVCDCFCTSGPISMDVILEKEAFVVGEVAKIKIEVNNMSNKIITKLILTIKMTIESKATSPIPRRKYNEQLIGLISDSGVEPRKQRTYKFDFTIPSYTKIPNFAGLTLFTQWSVLQVEAVIAGCHSNLNIDTGIKLGDISIIESATDLTDIPGIQIHDEPFSTTPPPPRNLLTDNPPPYPPEGKAHLLSTNPSIYPVPNRNDIGFSREISVFPNNGISLPMSISDTSSSSASAPQDESTPSAPTQAKLEERTFDSIDGREPPPPSYEESMKIVSNSKRSSAPLKKYIR